MLCETDMSLIMTLQKASMFRSRSAKLLLVTAGYFMAGQSEVGAKVSNSKSPPGGALWLVYKWEALRPLSEYAYASQSSGGILFGTNEEAALRSRCRMLR